MSKILGSISEKYENFSCCSGVHTVCEGHPTFYLNVTGNIFTGDKAAEAFI
jgi:hypothetical protein